MPILNQGADVDAHSVLSKLHEVRIFRVGELAAWLACSVPTARRRLRQWQARTSINCNGAYYTLADVPQFDSNGLWWCRGTLFSRHGNLRQTVCALVAGAPAGMTSRELSGALGMEARAFLSHFRQEPRLCRIREGRRDVWLANDPQLRGRQLSARRRGEHAQHGLPSDAEAVLILVELIRHPQSDAPELVRLLRAQGTPVTEARIRRLLEHHGMAKGGAADSASRGR